MPVKPPPTTVIGASGGSSASLARSRRAVDDQPDALAEQGAVVDRGIAGAGHELVQPDAFDELRARIDQRDVDVGARPQAVGRERSGVTATDDHDLVVCVVLDHALKTPRIAET
jgi:hypothetical protein